MSTISLLTSQAQEILKIKFLQIHLDEKFSSAFAGHRDNIRKDIVSKFSTALSSVEKEKILDLNFLPTSSNFFFSISHNKSYGGYAVSDQPIGFDLEEFERISEASIKRICTVEEIHSAPHQKFLWSAKESLVKLNSATEKISLLVSDSHVVKWDEVSKNIFYFATKPVKNQISQGTIMDVWVKDIHYTLSLSNLLYTR